MTPDKVFKEFPATAIVRSKSGRWFVIADETVADAFELFQTNMYHLWGQIGAVAAMALAFVYVRDNDGELPMWCIEYEIDPCQDRQLSEGMSVYRKLFAWDAVEKDDAC